MSERTGHCHCGAVRYRLSAEPVAARVCWCRDCQYIASNGTVNVLVPTAALEIEGQTSEYTKTADSVTRSAGAFVRPVALICSRTPPRGRSSPLYVRAPWTIPHPRNRQ